MPRIEDAYRLLGISAGATPEEISRAYRLGAKQVHPDVFDGDAREAQRKFCQLTEAYHMCLGHASQRYQDEAPDRSTGISPVHLARQAVSRTRSGGSPANLRRRRRPSPTLRGYAALCVMALLWVTFVGSIVWAAASMWSEPAAFRHHAEEPVVAPEVLAVEWLCRRLLVVSASSAILLVIPYAFRSSAVAVLLAFVGPPFLLFALCVSIPSPPANTTYGQPDAGDCGGYVCLNTVAILFLWSVLMVWTARRIDAKER